MGARLPILYALLVIAEVAYLSYRYATNAPASSDPFSVRLGWIGLGSMTMLLVYSFARRAKSLRKLARLSHWLHFHIFLAVFGFIAAFFHSMHIFTKPAINVLNPGVLNFIACTVVFCSGLYGRYMYSMLPRRMGGEQMAASEVQEEIDKIDIPFPDEVKRLWVDARAANTVFGLISTDLATRRAIRDLRRLALDPKVKELAEKRVRLERRMMAWQATDRIFRRWIVLHRPIAGIMYVLSFMHVIISYMFTPIR